MKTWKPLALLALTLSSGCTSLSFVPTANWWSEGGRLCAATRQDAGQAWDRPAPRTCVQEAEAQAPAEAEWPATGGGW